MCIQCFEPGTTGTCQHLQKEILFFVLFRIDCDRQKKFHWMPVSFFANKSTGTSGHRKGTLVKDLRFLEVFLGGHKIGPRGF